MGLRNIKFSNLYLNMKDKIDGAIDAIRICKI